MKIGGNTVGVIQVKKTQKNKYGERVPTWMDAFKVKGWLDLSNGTSDYLNYNAKTQDSTHIFLCDYRNFAAFGKQWHWNPFSFRDGVILDTDGNEIPVTEENTRMVINGKTYAVQLIDDPMGMHQHYEIYLKYMDMEGGTDNG